MNRNLCGAGGVYHKKGRVKGQTTNYELERQCEEGWEEYRERSAFTGKLTTIEPVYSQM